MDHAEVRERLEAALLAPGKLQALDLDATPDGEELRRHLGSCAACARELGALRETAALLAAGAPDDLGAPPHAKERVLRAIRETGIERRGATRQAEEPGALRALPPIRSRWAARLSWVGLAAAAILLVLGALAAVDLAAQRDRSAQQARELAHVTATRERLLRSSAEMVVLRDAAGKPAGTVVYSAASRELVVVSDALAAPVGEDGYECYVDRAGKRTAVGYMRYSNGLAYWAGQVEEFGGAPGSGERFVVVLHSRAAEPVLQGDL